MKYNVYTTISEHCIRQIIKRNKKDGKQRTRKSAIMFGINVFREMILNEKYKGSNVIRKYSRFGLYSLDNGKHKFIFKQVGKIEYILVTYIKLDKKY